MNSIPRKYIRNDYLTRVIITDTVERKKYAARWRIYIVWMIGKKYAEKMTNMSGLITSIVISALYLLLL